ncbi:oxidoreductase [Clavibacter michiganensis]|nr:mannitol dehydrogenase family protein [Clavibacter michiganensis]PPF62462.1 oxidoreductase [Clavibacter michiganensis]
MSRNLNRTNHPGGAAVRDRRILHLGLGAFHRSHQAWYTAHASDGHRWGITAYSGRRPDAAVALRAQDGLYTLIERSENTNSAQIIDVITEAVDGADVAHFEQAMADPSTALVTLTITEAGYQPSDLSEPSVLGRLAAGLEARRVANVGPIALVSCDNLADNGAVLRDALAPHLDALGASAVQWAASQVSYVSTSVDRITPRTTPDDLTTAERLTGLRDECAVTTEPFSDWTLQGEFPAGRPEWESSGARFVDDLEPFERRKLWLLNGAHTLLAAAGTLSGYSFVHEAFADPVLRGWVEDFWDAACRHLPEDLDLAEYRRALARRFDNSSIRHALDQISLGAEAKLGVRVVPVVTAELDAGLDATAAARPIAAYLMTMNTDADPHEVLQRLDSSTAASIRPSVECALDDLRRVFSEQTAAR